MSLPDLLNDAMHRLDSKHLLGPGGSVSVRVPDSPDMLLATPQQPPTRVPLSMHGESRHTWHAAIYRARPDVGAIVLGGGLYARMLHDVGNALPQVFDEQARHLGRTALPLPQLAGDPDTAARRCLITGGNTWICGDAVMVFGNTAQRLTLNAELLEKCAKAYVLAKATGARVHTLPWWVCRIANGRLQKDQRRAAERFASGLLPEEVKGY
ncbi:class II aldolase/adducin family protein [Dyella mobilis]|uniref:Class II aldolase/adducin N-terminal domain-containing protein n=1 Tax=Dyella mobilis TaxID=1849582 RepID=A0ABS2KDM2_9GAMM|nr:class II aldolase/adducin family protein [Dyella mobilis]MBM7129264.1 hypothetical protein [Dyella mobilis]GLQ98556.1 hypothetical protein GCM10007863_29760 [Dyella mobilis]